MSEQCDGCNNWFAPTALRHVEGQSFCHTCWRRRSMQPRGGSLGLSVRDRVKAGGLLLLVLMIYLAAYIILYWFLAGLVAA